jgi:serine/threonine-protein kinase RsbW
VLGAEDDAARGAPAQRSVLVRVGATAAQLPPLRVVASDLAARADFDLDAVADLRLAVDEAAAELVAVAAPDASITCTFLVGDEGVEATVTVPVEHATTLRTDSFGWRVLATLVDQVHLLDHSDGGQPVVGIALTKTRGGNSGDGTSRR